MMNIGTKRTLNTALVFALAASSLVSCKKDEDETPAPSTPPNEEEVITTLLLTFTDTENAANTYELRFTDADGDGGNDPVLTGDTLPAGRAYNLALRVLDESGSTPEEITEEIDAEAEEHQFFFQTAGIDLQVAYADTDANGRPVGLLNTAITGAAGSGTLTVTLRHEPNKAAPGVSDGDITNAGGETDIEVAFPVVID
jgi:hypothetical protein